MASPAITITDAQQVTLSISAVDAKGQPTTQLPSAPTWSAVDTTGGTLTPSADGSSAVYAAGNEGTAQVSVSATVTNPDGSTATIVGQITITIVGGVAAAIAITASAPVAEAAPVAPAVKVGG